MKLIFAFRAGVCEAGTCNLTPYGRSQMEEQARKVLAQREDRSVALIHSGLPETDQSAEIFSVILGVEPCPSELLQRYSRIRGLAAADHLISIGTEICVALPDASFIDLWHRPLIRRLYGHTRASQLTTLRGNGWAIDVDKRSMYTLSTARPV